MRWGVDDFQRAAEVRDEWLNLYNDEYYPNQTGVDDDEIIPTLAARLDRAFIPRWKRFISTTAIAFFTTLVVGAVIGVLVARVALQVLEEEKNYQFLSPPKYR